MHIPRVIAGLIPLLMATVAHSGISTDAETGWGVVDRNGYVFETATSSPYPGLAIHGDSTVRASILLANCDKDAGGTVLRRQTLALAPESGDLATVTALSGGRLGNQTAGQRGYFLVGENGGWGNFDLQAGTLQFYELRVCANAAVPDADAQGDAPPLIMIGKDGASATVNMHYFANDSVKPVRVVFDGGHVSHSDGGGGYWFCANAGDFVVESRNGHPIHIASGGHNVGLNSCAAGRRVSFVGAGDFWWDASGGGTNGGELDLYDGCDLRYTGDTVLEGANRTTATLYISSAGLDNVFPTGADKGDLVLGTQYPATPTWVNLNGTSQELNGIFGRAVSASGVDWGVVSNRSGTASTVVLGKFRDGAVENVAIRGRSAGNVVVRQVGHVVTLANVDIDDYRVEAGELRISTGVRIGSLQVSDSARVTVVGGAANTYLQTMPNLPEGIAFRKTGTGWLTMPAPGNGNGRELRVDGGTLRFGGTATDDAWWRFTAKGALPPKECTFFDGSIVTATLGLGTIGLFDVGGIDRASGPSVAATGTTASELAAGRVTSVKPIFPISNAIYTNLYGEAAGENPVVLGANCSSLANLFAYKCATNYFACADISTWWGGVVYTNAVPVPDNPATWENVVWRVSSGSAAFGSYALAPLTNIGYDKTQVTDWTLESSADGVHWTLRDSRSGEKPGTDPRHYSYNGGKPYLFNAASAGRFEGFGKIAIASGATLDLDEIPDANVSVSQLEVDMSAGGGTITKFRPAANGTLYLVNADRADFVGENRKMSVDIPLSVGRMVDGAAMTGWRLVVNGETVEVARVCVSPVTGRFRVFPGQPADASLAPLTDGGAIAVNAATAAERFPLIRSGGIVTVPSEAFLSLAGWDSLDDFPVGGVVLAEAAAYDLPNDFSSWTFEPDDGERTLVVEAVEGQLRFRFESADFIYPTIDGQFTYSGLGGIDFVPSASTAGWKASYTTKSGARESDGSVPFVMSAEGSSDIDGRLSFAQKDGSTVSVRYSFVPKTDVTIASLTVYPKLPHSVLTTCVREGVSKSLPLAAAENATTDKITTAADFLDSSGTKRLGFTFPVPTEVRLSAELSWKPGYTQTSFYCPTSGTTSLVGGQEYVIEFDISADRPIRALAKGVAVKEGPQWMKAEPVLRIAPGSALDFSSMRPSDGPAGKYGRVVRVGDHFEFENLPGVKQRFFATNISTFPPDGEGADVAAADLARQGYNMMRLHMFEEELVAGMSDDAQCTINPDALDRFDRFVSACISNGIYLTTDVYVNRKPTWRALGYDKDGSLEMNDFKFMLYGSESALENLKTFTRNLYTHVNPYTGRTLAEEPALVNVSTVNEGGLMLTPVAATALIPELEGLWLAWLAQKRTAEPELYADVTDAVPSAFDETPNGRAFAVFIADRQRLLFTRLRSFLHDELGCHVPMTANMNADFRQASYELLRSEINDYVDAHFYIDHPSYFNNHDWQMPAKLGNGNANPMNVTTYGAQSVVRHRHVDRPFCVTEYNYVAPASRRGCGGLLTGTMAGLQGWDGLMRFAWGSPTLSDELPSQKKLNNFSLATDSLNLMSERASFALYMRGDVAELTRSYVVNLPPEGLDRPVAGVTQRLNQMKNLWTAWYAKTGVIVSNDVPEGAVSGGTWPEPVGYDQETAMAHLGLELVDGKMPVAGDGAVTIGENLFTVNTPKTMGVFLEKGGARAGRLTVEVGNMPATVWASSLDGAPIGGSRRILLGHLTDLQNSGLSYLDARKTIMDSWGALPHLMRVATAEISLAVGPGVFKVYALAMDGSRKARVPSRKAGGVLSFTADVAGSGEFATCMYEIVRNAGLMAIVGREE